MNQLEIAQNKFGPHKNFPLYSIQILGQSSVYEHWQSPLVVSHLCNRMGNMPQQRFLHMHVVANITVKWGWEHPLLHCCINVGA